jgi:hypothetical protein
VQNIFPFLKHLPNWIPGSGLTGKKHAAILKTKLKDMAEIPFREAVEELVRELYQKMLSRTHFGIG